MRTLFAGSIHAGRSLDDYEVNNNWSNGIGDVVRSIDEYQSGFLSHDQIIMEIALVAP